MPKENDGPQFDTEFAPNLEDQFSKLRTDYESSGESAPSLPSSWSVKTTSLPESASVLMADELLAKKEQLNAVNVRLEQYKMKVKALSAELKESRKRRRDEPSSSSKSASPADSSASPEEVHPPSKKTSPEPKSPVKTTASKKAVISLTASSEEEPPSPVKPATPKPVVKKPSYAGLNSVLCAFREGGFTPGKDGMTFELCAELASDEIMEIARWSPRQLATYHPMIFDALELVYPGKTSKWLKLPFAKSHTATANYWVKVLNKWKQIWLKKAAKLVSPPPVHSPAMLALTKRIRKKLDGKTTEKIREVTKNSASAPAKKVSAKPIVVSGSDSDGEEQEVLMTPEAEEAGEDKKAVEKLADPPGSYSRAEMKAFAKHAKAIRNLPSDKNHTPATADFIDAEFSDNSGRAARILRSPFSWKRQKFKEITSKAARVMEERSRAYA